MDLAVLIPTSLPFKGCFTGTYVNLAHLKIFFCSSPLKRLSQFIELVFFWWTDSGFGVLFCFPFVFLIGYDDLLSIPCPSLSTWVRIFEVYVSTSETDKQNAQLNF